MRVLETRLRRDGSGRAENRRLRRPGRPESDVAALPCLCKVQLNVSDDPAQPQWQWYKVVFTRDADNPDGTSAWSVGVTVAQPDEDLSGYPCPCRNRLQPVSRATPDDAP